MFDMDTVLCIEGVNLSARNQLAEYLTRGQPRNWTRHVEIAYLYPTLKARKPLCAVVRLPRSPTLKDTCLAKHNSTLSGNKIKVVGLADCKNLASARWILKADDHWTSMPGSKHWVEKALVALTKAKRTKKNPKEEVEDTAWGFYAWERLMLEGEEEEFCYPVVDCGTTIYTERDKDRLKVLLSLAAKAGVQRIVFKGNSLKRAERAKELAALYPEQLGFSVGYEPWLVEKWVPEKIGVVETLSEHPACVAIGECGLDLFGKNPSQMEEQKQLFTSLLELACKKRKPVMVVQRAAQTLVLDLLTKFKGRLPPVAIRTMDFQYCDFDSFTQNGYYIVVTGAMFEDNFYNSYFFKWLRSAQPWQLKYLLLASDSFSSHSYPSFYTNTVQSEAHSSLDTVHRAHYSHRVALLWGRREGEYWGMFQRKQSSPLVVPILLELLSDGLGISPEACSAILLENAQSFFKYSDTGEERKEQRRGGEQKREKEKKWEQAAFWFPLSLSLLAAYCSMRVAGQYCFDLFC